MRQCAPLLFRWRVRFWLFVGEDIPRIKLLAVGEHHVHDEPNGPAVLGGRGPYSDVVARLEGFAAPAQIAHAQRVLCLHDPMDRLTGIIGGVYEKQAMGVGPIPLLDSSFYRNRLTRIVGRCAVMRQRGNASYCYRRNQGDYR
jgi:hypothetical protein